MGSNCSCFHAGNIDEKQFIQEVSTESKLMQSHFSRPVQESENLNTSILIDINQVIKLQSILKGYIDRHQTKNINILASPSLLCSSPIQELGENELKEYLNPSTLKIISTLGDSPYKPQETLGLKSKGPVLIESRSVYIGQWNPDNIREGIGTQYWKDGSLFEGTWKENKANGKGRMVHSNGDVYEGDWHNNRANGYGIYIHSYGKGGTNAGVKYEGQWKNDKQHGKGNEFWPNGDRFCGNYENGVKYGNGKFEWADGSWYEGEFYKNFIHGFGTYKWSDGRCYTGDWKKNQMNGKGKFFWPDGRKFEGNYVKDKKSGYGVFTWKDGRRYEGFWSNGKQHGEGIYTSSNGVAMSGTWHNGNKVHTSQIQ